jgi:hypothetical protein
MTPSFSIVLRDVERAVQLPKSAVMHIYVFASAALRFWFLKPCRSHLPSIDVVIIASLDRFCQTCQASFAKRDHPDENSAGWL